MTPEQTTRAHAAIEALKAGLRALADAAALATEAVRALMTSWTAAVDAIRAQLRENRARSLARRAAREAAWRAEWAALTPDERRARAAASGARAREAFVDLRAQLAAIRAATSARVEGPAPEPAL